MIFPRFFGSLFVLVAMGLSVKAAYADEDPGTDVYRALCATAQVEGHYVIKATPVGVLHINIVCTGRQALAASVHAENETVNFSLVHTAVDGNVISFVTFHTSAEDARTMSSQNTDLRLRLDIPSLKRGVLKGTLRTLNRIDPMVINSSRASGFSNLLTSEAAAGSRPLEGSFAFHSARFNGVISVEIIGGIQRVNLNIPEMGAGRVLHNGLPARDAAGVLYATSGVDDGSFGNVGLLHVRGRMIGAGEMELYYLDTKKGLQGPFHATKRKVSRSSDGDEKLR